MLPSIRFREPTLRKLLRFGDTERAEVRTPLVRLGGVTPCSDTPGDLAMPLMDQETGSYSPKKKVRTQDAYNQWKTPKSRNPEQGKKRQQVSRKIQRRKIHISSGNAHNIRLGDMSGIAVVTARWYWCGQTVSQCISF